MLTGILVISMILIISIERKTFNPDDMLQVIDPDKLKDINPDLLIVQADSQELLDNKLKNTPVWTSLKAVQNNKVIYADSLNLHAGLWDCLPRSYYETNL